MSQLAAFLFGVIAALPALLLLWRLFLAPSTLPKGMTKADAIQLIRSLKENQMMARTIREHSEKNHVH